MDGNRIVSLIASRISLTHTCTIERNDVAGGTDSWNQPVTSGWQPHLTDQPCRFWVRAGMRSAGEKVVDTTTIVVVEDMRMILLLGTDVTENDRVATVSERGAEIQAGPIGIRAVLAHPDHLELVLVRID
jgi:hypothetical protein